MVPGLLGLGEHLQGAAASALPSPEGLAAPPCLLLKSSPAQDQCLVHLSSHLTGSRASRGFAGWCRDDQGGCGGPGFLACHVTVNANYLALEANGNKILTGRKLH